MAQRNFKVGAIKDVSGEVNIAGGDIYRHFTAEQVFVLCSQITSTFQPNPFDGLCPYKRLDGFEEEDSGSIQDPAQPAASAFGVTHND